MIIQSWLKCGKYMQRNKLTSLYFDCIGWRRVQLFFLVSYSPLGISCNPGQPLGQLVANFPLTSLYPFYHAFTTKYREAQQTFLIYRRIYRFATALCVTFRCAWSLWHQGKTYLVLMYLQRKGVRVSFRRLER